MKIPSPKHHLGFLGSQSKSTFAHNLTAHLPLTSEFFWTTVGSFFSLNFLPAFCPSRLNLKPEAATRLVPELDATEEAKL